MSAQAVGGAVGHNPIALIVPCHRVLASDGSLRGYAGGVDRKEWLLKMEGVNMSGLSTPPDADDGGGETVHANPQRADARQNSARAMTP